MCFLQHRRQSNVQSQSLSDCWLCRQGCGGQGRGCRSGFSGRKEPMGSVRDNRKDMKVFGMPACNRGREGHAFSPRAPGALVQPNGNRPGADARSQRSGTGMNKLVWHEFSTNVMPESDRLPVFCEELRRQAALDVVAGRDTRFSGTIKRCLLGMVDVARITTTVASYVRTPELVSD